MADPTLKTKLIDMGVDVIEDNTSKSMISTMRNNADQWGKLAEKAGIKP
jgi:hypothetical protein